MAIPTEITDRAKVAVVGSGPAGLMAATLLARDPRVEVHLFEKRSGLGRKLLVAGSSGLNISHHLAPDDFADHYESWTPAFWRKLLSQFGPAEWIRFIEDELEMETFRGTSDRYFVREMKASGLLRKWTALLISRGVHLHTNSELANVQATENGVELSFGAESPMTFAFAVCALGGGSWEPEPPAWPALFQAKGLVVFPFTPRNVGYEVAWKPEFLKEAEGKPLKKIRFQNARGSKEGELVITNYGLEGTPIYFYGETGACTLDLKPDFSYAQVIEKLTQVKENFAPIRRAKLKLGLSEGAMALLFHHLPDADRMDLERFARAVKKFPLTLKAPRPLTEAIYSKGGLSVDELTPELELKRFPRVYCAGEMIDWHAPTGGFLIQAAVSMGAVIAETIRSKLA